LVGRREGVDETQESPGARAQGEAMENLGRLASDRGLQRWKRGLSVSFVALMLAGPAAAQGVVKIGTNNLPVTRGDPTTSLTFQYLYVWQSMFDALTIVDEQGKPQPRLAASWQNISPTTWQFKLRPGVKFHNGAPLTAEAIVTSVEVLISDDGKVKGGPVYGALRNLAGAKRIDDMTVEISTATPGPILPSELAALRIAEPKAWTQLGREGFSRQPAGTGPFRQVSWDDTKIVLTRFDDAWIKPKVDGLEILNLPEMASRVQAFASGQIDVAWTLSADTKSQVERAGGRLSVGPTPSVAAMMIHAQKPGPTQDKRVRQAFNYALNKAYADTLFGGLAKAGSQPGASSVRGYQADIKPYPFDTAKAKQLLTEAGYPNGFPLSAEIVITGAKDMYEAVANDLARIGVPTVLKPITLPDLLARRDGRKEFEAELFGYNFGGQPSNDMMRGINSFHSCLFPRKWTCFPEIEPVIAMVNAEFDEKKRDAGLRQIAQYYHENAPGIWLEEQIEIDAVSAKVRNYRNVNWVINFPEWELAR